jgi:hypothetical protein
MDQAASSSPWAVAFESRIGSFSMPWWSGEDATARWSDEDALEGGVNGAALRCATARRHGWWPAQRRDALLHAVKGAGRRGGGAPLHED